MKKLNRKGFTLVELLAVIIILAIVVGVSIPAVLTTTNNAKVKAGKTAASTVADWIDRQYQVATTGLDTGDVATSTARLDANFKTQCSSDGSTCTNKTIDNAAFIAAAGVQLKNVTQIQVKINTSTGRSCVILTIPETSEYYFNNVTLCATGEQNCYASKTTIKGGVC